MLSVLVYYIFITVINYIVWKCVSRYDATFEERMNAVVITQIFITVIIVASIALNYKTLGMV